MIFKTLMPGLLATSALVPAAIAQDAEAKNVVVLITDGAGVQT